MLLLVMIKGTLKASHTKTKCTDDMMSPKSVIKISAMLELIDAVMEESCQLETNNFSLNMR